MLTVNAQKEYNMWYFGRYAGLNFNTIPPSSISDSRMIARESSTSMCDSAGNLLFYTNGDTIWNRNHQLMLNWKSGRPFAAINSATQGSMALRMPGNNNLYYIFQGLSDENISGLNKDSMLRYCIIDIKGDGGLGSVMVKDQPLIKARNENFAVTLHKNGKDLWVAATDNRTGIFNCIRTTNGNFLSPAIQQKLSPKWDQFSRFIKFSPDSRILYSKESRNSNGNYFINLYQFDNSNGKLSQHISIPKGNQIAVGHGYSEFSPDSRFLYTVISEGNIYYLCQYDLSKWDSAAISSSKKIIFSIPVSSPSYHPFAELQLGPDGKIYCFNIAPLYNNSKKISIINNPNNPGVGCNFWLENIDLNKGTIVLGGPYYPSFYFRNAKVNLGIDTTLCLGDSMTLRCNPAKQDKIKWSTGDTTDAIIIKNAGIYSVALSRYGLTQSDTIKVFVGPKFKVFIGNDTAFCHQFSHLIKASPGFAKYNWNTGSNNMQITVNSKGIYSVKVLDSNSCPSGDTIAIDEIKKPLIKISYDSVNCKYVYLTSDSIKGLSYLWNTGETKNAITVSKKGWYSITARHQFCSNTDSILVDKLAMPEIDLGADTSLCLNEIILKTKEQGIYLWNTGQKTPSITVNQPGKYWLTITRNNCSSTDTVEVKLCEDMLVYIPDVFSPNGDGINDVFKIYGSNIIYAELEIFNRWGEKLLQTNGKEAQWDGTYKNEMCMEGVYFYMVKIKGKKLGSMKYLSGSLTLIR